MTRFRTPSGDNFTWKIDLGQLTPKNSIVWGVFFFVLDPTMATVFFYHIYILQGCQIFRVARFRNLENPPKNSFFASFAIISTICCISIITLANTHLLAETTMAILNKFWATDSESGISFCPGHQNFAGLPGPQCGFSHLYQNLIILANFKWHILKTELKNKHFEKNGENRSIF